MHGHAHVYKLKTFPVHGNYYRRMPFLMQPMTQMDATGNQTQVYLVKV